MICRSARCISGQHVLEQSVRVESDPRNATPDQNKLRRASPHLEFFADFGATRLRHLTQARTEASRMGRMSAMATR
jgi:hypothetical protein